MSKITVANFRDNSHFLYHKSFRRFVILDKSHYTLEMRAMLNDPDAYLRSTAGPFFKNQSGDTTTIAAVNIATQKIVIKRYNIKGIWHRFRKCFVRSRAMHAWLNIYKLQNIGVNTLRPIAVIEERFGPLRGTTYLITEYVENSVRGCDYFAKNAPQTAAWALAVRNIAAMAVTLHKARLLHHDFQYGNLLLVGDVPLLLDLDHMEHCSQNSRYFNRYFQADILHFLDFVRSNEAAYLMFKQEFIKHGLLFD